eukprot:1380158-Prymnesium_polylepis.1
MPPTMPGSCSQSTGRSVKPYELGEARLARAAACAAIAISTIVVSTVVCSCSARAVGQQRGEVCRRKPQRILVAEEILAPLAETRLAVPEDGVPRLELLEAREGDLAL